MPDNLVGASAFGTYVGGRHTHTFGVGTPAMTNLAVSRGPQVRPGFEVVPEHLGPRDLSGYNNEDLIKHSHASYVAYVNRYNTVYN